MEHGKQLPLSTLDLEYNYLFFFFLQFQSTNVGYRVGSEPLVTKLLIAQIQNEATVM